MVKSIDMVRSKIVRLGAAGYGLKILFDQTKVNMSTSVCFYTQDTFFFISKVDANELFEFLKNYHTSNTIPHLRHDFDPQHKSLIPILRPYQANAVRWMLSM